MVGHLGDVITYAKFQVEIFRGYDVTGGRISHFPIDFCMGLTTVHRDCAACDTGDKSSITCNDIFVTENENKNGNYLQNENHSGYGHLLLNFA